jgi:hypothetical protein
MILSCVFCHCDEGVAYSAEVTMGGRAASLLEQGRYSELLAGLAGSPDTPDTRAEARVWKVRCRTEQGYVRAAADLARGAPAEVCSAGDAGVSLRLWRGFVTLYDSGGPLFSDVIAEFSALCAGLGSAAGSSAAVRALAADLRARAEAIRFTLNGQGPEGRGPIVTALAAAAEGYRAAGFPREATAALRRAASFAVDGLSAERARARILLARARDEAAQAGLVLAQASAELSLAELALRALLDGSSDRDQTEVLTSFDALADVFRQAGHAFGDAQVKWCAGRWLLAYGVPEGLQLGYDAIGAFAAADIPSSEQRVWSALSAWHMAHGDLAQAAEARKNESRLVSAMGYHLAAEVRVLDEANQAFRSGHVAQARSMLAQRSRTSSGMQAANRLMLVTSANAIGLRAEARRLAEELIDDLTSGGSSVILGEALTVLSTLVMGTDGDRAAGLLRQAAEVAHAAESPTEEAKYRAQLAWATVVRRLAEHKTPLISDDARAEFERAEQLLATQRDLEARSQLVRLCQSRAQAAFFGSDWQACGHWLAKAENIARALNLQPDLAFLLCYQGLALIRVARSTGAAAYDQAAARFDESRAIFAQIDLPAFIWQVTFYRALCDLEAVRWPDPDAGRPAERLRQASVLMEEASGLIDSLRESSERGDADRQQHAWMAFSVDKQTFYGQGFRLAWDARGDAVAGWQWLERMKGRALLDALADQQSTTVLPAPAPVPATQSTAAAESGHREAEDAAPLRRAARQSEPPGFAEIRTLLAAEESSPDGRRVVLAEYLCTPDRTLLFGARSDWAAPRVEPVALDHAALRQFAAGTFHAQRGVRMMMEDLADGGIPAWHRFASLLDPIASWSDPDDLVYLIPYGILHDLPLHTLPVGGVPLIERNPVCYAPAVAVLRHTLTSGETSASLAETTGGAAVFGDSRGDLPYARTEAAAIAAMFGVTPQTGDAVTKERVLHALDTAGIVHLAGHGHLSTADGFASYLDLAGTGVLRAADLLGRRSRASLAVLSGCETGVSEQRPGDEIVGFVRALLLSGVHSVLASQWRVTDASTQELLSDFHRAARTPGTSRAEALRQAVRAIRADPRYGHPYHWGGFALVGSWR